MSYVSQKQRANPAGIAAAILINGGVVAGAFLMSVTVGPKIMEPHISTFDVPVDKPPPVPPVQTNQEVVPKKPDPVYAGKPVVDIPLKPLNQISTSDVITDIPLYTDPDGAKIALNTGVKNVIEKIIPPPVYMAAARDHKFARDFQPAYPAGLLQREMEGKATLKVLIGADGRVRQAIIISATHTDFGKAAERQALAKWRFVAATRDGKPVEDWQTLTVRFNIN